MVIYENFEIRSNVKVLEISYSDYKRSYGSVWYFFDESV